MVKDNKDFDVKTIFKGRPHERQQFSILLDGKEYRGHYTDNEIQWMHPHPIQDVDQDQVDWLEKELHQLLEGDKKLQHADDVEIESVMKGPAHVSHYFKLNIGGEIFRGMIFNGVLHWYRPDPLDKLSEEEFEELKQNLRDQAEGQKE
ncbi:hypothetical protein GCM10028778_15850 [Barrientosiimonas marina]|uniref:Uncharacterized protein n=1 Tax=Lentibacillus kimchii TaxID=1542911 RepID=A0ABW2UWC5_9BACI